MDRKAFTVLELLVVIVVLSILLSLLLPGFGRAREAARRARCANNLRQHGIAWYLYLDDHDERFPAYGRPVVSDVWGCTFGGKQGTLFAGRPQFAAKRRILNPYLDIDVSRPLEEVEKDPGLEIFHCPDDIRPNGATEHTTSSFNYLGNSYRLNIRLFMFGHDSGERPLSSVTAPFDKFCLEMCLSDNNPGHGGRGLVPRRTPVMVLFLDGHVAGPFLDTADWYPNPGGKLLNDPSGSPEEWFD